MQINNKSLQIIYNNKIITKTKDIKHKMIYEQFNKQLVPNVNLKWENELKGDIDWEKVWNIYYAPLQSKIL